MSPRTINATDAAATPSLNLTVVAGTLSSAPRIRDLPSGTTLAQLEVTVDATPAESVPVVVFDPPSAVTGLVSGAKVVVVGRVRRRFYRAGGATQSRTEVVATRVARAGSRRSVEPALRRARELLDLA